MNWRRGVLLAGINLVLALPMICILAAQDAQSLRDWKQHSAIGKTPWIDSSGELSAAPTTNIVRAQEEQTVEFNPCGLWGHTSVQVSVVQMGNIPAAIASQWRADCPPKRSIAGLLGVQIAGQTSDRNFRAMRRVDLAVCLLIAMQWFLIGGFPLKGGKHWWSEPGAFITASTAIAAAIALIPFIEGLARLPAAVAAFAWLWWFGLLLWVLLRLAWNSTLGGLRRLSN